MANFDDEWCESVGELEGRPHEQRIRRHARKLVDPALYPTVFRVTWAFESPDDSGLPDAELRARMDEFEQLMVPELERDWLCIFYNIDVVDGVKYWAAYTSDVDEAATRLNVAMGWSEAYPIEISDVDDVTWLEYFALGEGEEVDDSDVGHFIEVLRRALADEGVDFDAVADDDEDDDLDDEDW